MVVSRNFNQEDAGEATARPLFGVRSEKNLRQKRYKKVFIEKKRASEKGILNGNYALCIMVHNSAYRNA
jgi:hypothetical protein